jgi:PAS domain S-box-containing protein
LKLVIESAPVSLLITGPEGNVVAANRSTLTLLGVERLDQVVGGGLEELVAPEDRERLLAFVAQVCHGEPGSLEYDLVGGDGSRRTLETHAVPLRREGIAPAGFLGATWDVSERKRSAAALRQTEARYEFLEAQHAAEREVLEEAITAAKTAYERLSRDGAAERQALEKALRDADERRRELSVELTSERDRLRAALSEAGERHERMAAEWAGDRDVLVTRLREAEEREAALSAQLLTEETARQTALEKSESQYQASLAERAAENRQLEAALSNMRAQFEEMQARFRAEGRNLTGTIQELERRCALLAEDRNRCTLLLDERDGREAELAEVLRALREACTHAERILDNRQKTGDAFDGWRNAPDRQANPTGSPTAAADLEPAKESSWGF